MFVSTNTCDGKGECIKQCPTKAIRLINGKALSCLTCGLCYKNCPSNAIFINSYGGCRQSQMQRLWDVYV